MGSTRRGRRLREIATAAVVEHNEVAEEIELTISETSPSDDELIRMEEEVKQSFHTAKAAWDDYQHYIRKHGYSEQRIS